MAHMARSPASPTDSEMAAMLAGALQHAGIMLFCCDLDLRYTWLANPLPGLSGPEMMGLCDKEHLHEGRRRCSGRVQARRGDERVQGGLRTRADDRRAGAVRRSAGRGDEGRRRASHGPDRSADRHHRPQGGRSGSAARGRARQDLRPGHARGRASPRRREGDRGQRRLLPDLRARARRGGRAEPDEFRRAGLGRVRDRAGCRGGPRARTSSSASAATGARSRWKSSSSASTYQGRSLRIAHVRDLTAQKAAESALRESEERYRALAASTREGVVIHDGERIVEVNDAFCFLHGTTRDQAIGRPAYTFLVLETCSVPLSDITRVSQEPYEAMARREDLDVSHRGRGPADPVPGPGHAGRDRAGSQRPEGRRSRFARERGAPARLRGGEQRRPLGRRRPVPQARIPVVGL